MYSNAVRKYYFKNHICEKGTTASSPFTQSKKLLHFALHASTQEGMFWSLFGTFNSTRANGFSVFTKKNASSLVLTFFAIATRICDNYVKWRTFYGFRSKSSRRLCRPRPQKSLAPYVSAQWVTGRCSSASRGFEWWRKRGVRGTEPPCQQLQLTQSQSTKKSGRGSSQPRRNPAMSIFGWNTQLRYSQTKKFGIDLGAGTIPVTARDFFFEIIRE